MAEIGTVLAVMSLTGQILAGIQHLHLFFSNVRHAPEFIISLNRELVCIQIIVDRVRVQLNSSSSVSQYKLLDFALKNCAEPIRRLQDLIKEHRLQGSEKGLKRRWNQIYTVFKRKDFERRIAELERAKSSLVAAEDSMITDLQNQTLAMVQEVRQAIVKVQPSIQVIEATARTDGSNSFGSAPEKSHETVAFAKQLVLSKMESTKELDSYLVTAVDSAISTAIQGAIEDHQKRHLGETSAPQNSQNWISGLSTQGSKDEKLAKCFKKLRSSYSVVINYKTWFGSLLIRRHEKTFVEERTFLGEVTSLEIGSTRLEIYVLPFTWFLSKGFIATLKHLGNECLKPTCRLMIEPVRVIRNDSPILEACRQGDVQTVRKLFNNGQASAHDRDESGRNLLDSTIVAMYRINGWHFDNLIEFLLLCGLKINDEATCYLAAGILENQKHSWECWNMLMSSSDTLMDWEFLGATLGVMLINMRPCLRDVTSRFDPMTNWSALTYESRFGAPMSLRLFNLQLSEDQKSTITADFGTETLFIPKGEGSMHIQEKCLALKHLFTNGLQIAGAIVDCSPFDGGGQLNCQLSLLAYALKSCAEALAEFFRQVPWELRDGRHKVLEEATIRYMAIVLKHGGSPDGRHTGSARFMEYSWSESSFLTDLALELNILELWREALVRSGLDANSIIDDTIYSGFTDLFDGLVYQESKIKMKTDQKRITALKNIATKKESLLRKCLKFGLTILSSII